MTDDKEGEAPSALALAAEAVLGQKGAASQARALILAAALASFILSVTLWFGGSREEGLFVGIWVPSILAFGALVVPREPAS